MAKKFLASVMVSNIVIETVDLIVRTTIENVFPVRIYGGGQ